MRFEKVLKKLKDGECDYIFIEGVRFYLTGDMGFAIVNNKVMTKDGLTPTVDAMLSDNWRMGKHSEGIIYQEPTNAEIAKDRIRLFTNTEGFRNSTIAVMIVDDDRIFCITSDVGILEISKNTTNHAIIKTFIENGSWTELK